MFDFDALDVAEGLAATDSDFGFGEHPDSDHDENPLQKPSKTGRNALVGGVLDGPELSTEKAKEPPSQTTGKAKGSPGKDSDMGMDKAPPGTDVGAGAKAQAAQNDAKALARMLPLRENAKANTSAVGDIQKETKCRLPVVEVLPWLFLGSNENATDIDALTDKGVTHILNVSTCEITESDQIQSFCYHNIQFEDSSDQLRRMALQDCSTLISEMHKIDNHHILVCSDENPSLARSLTVVLAYLVTHECISLREAYQKAKTKRFAIEPLRFLPILCDLECEAGIKGAPTLDAKKMGDGKTFSFDDEAEFWNVCCPHCSGWFIVQAREVNCTIFRHGAYKNTGLPLNPHASQETCERLLAEDKIYGCAQPVRFNPNKWRIPEEVVTKGLFKD